MLESATAAPRTNAEPHGSFAHAASAPVVGKSQESGSTSAASLLQRINSPMASAARRFLALTGPGVSGTTAALGLAIGGFGLIGDVLLPALWDQASWPLLTALAGLNACFWFSANLEAVRPRDPVSGRPSGNRVGRDSDDSIPNFSDPISPYNPTGINSIWR